jgi:hypothetical protein
MVQLRSFWMFLVASVALAVLGEGSTALAGCGDYVVIGGQEHANPAPMTHHAEQSSEHSSIPERMPCKGPGCSQSQLPFTPPFSAPVQIPEEHWGAAATLLSSSELALIGHAWDVTASRSLRDANPIFHPPR